MKETRIRGAYCLACGKTIDAASSVGGDFEPDVGDFTICFYCGHIMIFRERGGRLGLDNPNAKEGRQIAGDPRILAVQRARQAIVNEKVN